MATRNRVQRGEDTKAAGVFEGRVRKWRKQWLTADQSTIAGKRLFFYVWRPTEERGAAHVPRTNMVPVENPNSKPARLRRFAPVGEGSMPLKRGRPSLSGLGTEDRSATPAPSEAISAGVTQKTEGTAAPKIIRLKLKSSAVLGAAISGGGTPAPGTTPTPPGAAETGPGSGAMAAAAGGSAPLQGVPLQPRTERALPPPLQPGCGGAVAAAAAAQGDARLGDGEEEDDLLAELFALEPHEPCSPRNLDELIPDMAAAARHDATAVLLAGGGGEGAGWGPLPPAPPQLPPGPS